MRALAVRMAWGMMIGMDGQQGGGDYALGYTVEERQRLIEQGELVGHFTMRLGQYQHTSHVPQEEGSWISPNQT